MPSSVNSFTRIPPQLMAVLAEATLSLSHATITSVRPDCFAKFKISFNCFVAYPFLRSEGLIPYAPASHQNHHNMQDHRFHEPAYLRI